MIRLSRLTDYAVTLLTQMVSEGKGVWAASDLGAKSGVPLPTVSKILKQLSKGGIVTAQRGAAGGYRLAQPSETITIAAIIEAMDGPIALTDCTEGGDQDCNIKTICPMSGNWNKINQAVRRALETVSLADMATPGFQHEPTYSPPLAGGVRGGGVKQETPSPAKTKDLLRKSKFLLPLPQGEREEGAL